MAVSMENNTLVEEANAEGIVAKTVITLDQLPDRNVDHCGIVRYILRDSENEGA